jgi:hypothetical protein
MDDGLIEVKKHKKVYPGRIKNPNEMFSLPWLSF